MSSLTSAHVVIALQSFRVDAGGLPRTFHSDFDKKLIGGDALRYITQNKSRIIAVMPDANQITA